MKRSFGSIASFCALILASTTLTGCPPNDLTARRYDLSSSVSSAHAYPCSDGGYLVAGKGWVDRSDTRFVARLSSTGTLAWQTQFAGTSDPPVSAATPDGGLFMAIRGGLLGQPRIRIAKLDTNGNTTWDKDYGTLGAYSAPPLAMVATSDGGCVVTGVLQSDPDSVFVVRIDPQGNIVWERHLSGAVGGTTPNKMVVMADGGFAISGMTDRYRGRLLRLDVDGNLLWWKQFDDIQFTGRFYIAAAADGGFVLAGAENITPQILTLSGDTLSVACVMRADADGNLLWTSHFGPGAGVVGLFFRYYTLNDVAVDQDGRVLVCGEDTSAVVLPIQLDTADTRSGYVLCFDLLGKLKWRKDLGTDIDLTGLAFGADGQYVVTGSDHGKLLLATGAF